MDPLTISLIGFALQELVKFEPAVAAEFSRLMTKTDATPDEWRAAFSLASKPWESFGSAVPITVLTPPTTP